MHNLESLPRYFSNYSVDAQIQALASATVLYHYPHCITLCPILVVYFPATEDESSDVSSIASLTVISHS